MGYLAQGKEDGARPVVEGSMDIGGGRTAAAMHLAEVLGIAYDAVRPSVGDTESIDFTSTTGGSSATFKTGWACYQAAHDIKGQMIETVLVEVANPGHPFGLCGVGEVPIVPPMAAIANAIYGATGVRMRQLPMSPSKVLEALWAKQGNGHQTNGYQSHGHVVHDDFLQSATSVDHK